MPIPIKDSTIPQEKSAAVARGLREAFGVTEFDDIRVQYGGNSTSRVFRIVVQGTAYILKMIMRTDDASRHFACMRTAAEAGLAPHVWYTNAEDKVAITDFVDAVPLTAREALARVPATLRKLHALPLFPGVPNRINTTCMHLINEGSERDGFLQRFQAANILPQAECEELLARHAMLAAAYTLHEADFVSSHNDLFKPDNILFDGERIWLVDWEAAFRNDRYADLAAVANQLVHNEAEERAFLEAYFGQPPDEYQLARLFLMRQVCHAFYALGFLFLGSGGKPVDPSGSLPEYRDFQQHFWDGEIKLTDSEKKILYGRVHLEQLLRNTDPSRLDQALRIVSARHACA